MRRVFVRQLFSYWFLPIALLLFIIIVFVSLPFIGKADTKVFYPSLCTGDWKFPERAAGEVSPVSGITVEEDSATVEYVPRYLFCSFERPEGAVRPLKSARLTLYFNVPESLTEHAQKEFMSEGSGADATPVTVPELEALESPGNEDALEATSTVQSVFQDSLEKLGAAFIVFAEELDASVITTPESIEEPPAVLGQQGEEERALPPQDEAAEILDTNSLPGTTGEETTTVTEAKEEKEDEPNISEAKTESEAETNARLTVSYTFDGELWIDLGSISLPEEQYTYEVQLFNEADLERLVVRVKTEGGAGFDEVVYLRGMSIEAAYIDEREGIQIDSSFEDVLPMDFVRGALVERYGTYEAAALIADIEEVERSLYIVYPGVQSFSVKRLSPISNIAVGNVPLVYDRKVFWVARDGWVRGFDVITQTVFRAQLFENPDISGELIARFEGVDFSVAYRTGELYVRLPGGSEKRTYTDNAEIADLLEQLTKVTTPTLLEAGGVPSMVEQQEALVEAQEEGLPIQDGPALGPGAAESTSDPAFALTSVGGVVSPKRVVSAQDVDKNAVHSCGGLAFSLELSEGETVEENLYLSGGFNGWLLVGSLPAGIDVRFVGSEDYQYTVMPEEEEVSLAISRSTGFRPGNISIPIFYTIQANPDATITSTAACQINIITS